MSSPACARPSMPDALPFLSEPWVAALADAGSALPERPGASATVATTVVGGPGGKKAETSYRVTFVDGRIVDAAAGADGTADLAVSRPWDDALADLRGETGLDTSFMRGRAKVASNLGVLLSLLPVLRSDEWRAACASLAARTDA